MTDRPQGCRRVRPLRAPDRPSPVQATIGSRRTGEDRDPGRRRNAPRAPRSGTVAAGSDRAPAAGARSPQPGARSPQPVARSPQPVARSRQPVARSRQPVARSRQPVARSPQPGARSPQPGARSPQPVVGVRAARGRIRRPMAAGRAVSRSRAAAVVGVPAVRARRRPVGHRRRPASERRPGSPRSHQSGRPIAPAVLPTSRAGGPIPAASLGSVPRAAPVAGPASRRSPPSAVDAPGTALTGRPGVPRGEIVAPVRGPEIDRAMTEGRRGSRPADRLPRGSRRMSREPSWSAPSWPNCARCRKRWPSGWPSTW
jgi:hypothetical protein